MHLVWFCYFNNNNNKYVLLTGYFYSLVQLHATLVSNGSDVTVDTTIEWRIIDMSLSRE